GALTPVAEEAPRTAAARPRGRVVSARGRMGAEATTQINELPNTADRTRRCYPGVSRSARGGILLEIRRATDAPQPVRPYRGGMADRDISSSEARQRAGWGIG